jgi:hypothetical protein
MTIEEQKSDGHITLKEASERFGYAPDYIGQLIRKGKIEGKQVYANVAWVTTVEAMENYIANEKNSKKSTATERNALERFGAWVVSSKNAPMLEWSLRAVMVLLSIFAIMLFYFISVSIDRALLQRAEMRHKIESPAKKSAAISIPQPTLLNHETL